MFMLLLLLLNAQVVCSVEVYKSEKEATDALWNFILLLPESKKGEDEVEEVDLVVVLVLAVVAPTTLAFDDDVSAALRAVKARIIPIHRRRKESNRMNE
jgi:hypothetical protein